MSPNRRVVSRVTIKDVARASGVSASTVSFVLNDTPGQTLREETRERVRAAARRLGYTPHGIARALREGSSNVVLLQVGLLRGGPSLAGFVDGMADELSLLGHTLLVSHRATAGALQDAIAAVAPRAVVDVERPFAAEDPAHPDGGWVHGLAAHTLTQLRHLAHRGHRRIAFAVPTGRMPALVAARLDHARLAADALGVRAPEPFVVPADRPAARRALAGLLDGGQAPTAVAAFDDDVALQVLAAMADLGVGAPRDLAVIGFDADRAGALWSPALTSVRIDAAGYGRRAARVALGQDAGTWPARPSTVVARQST